MLVLLTALACTEPDEDSDAPEPPVDSEVALDDSDDSQEESIPPESLPDDSDPGPCAEHQRLEGSATIASIEELEDFGARYAEVGGDLSIEGVDYAYNLSPLICLHTIEGTLSLDANPQLASIGLDALESVGGLSITGNEALGTLEFPALTEIGGDFWIADNASATQFVIPSLASIGGHLQFDLPLSDLSPFSALESVDALTLDGLGELGSLAGLTAVVGDLELRGLPLITDLSTFEVTRFTDSLSIHEMPVVTLDGLGHLSGGDDKTVTVGENEKLRSIDGLNGMTELDTLWIHEMDNLESLNGLTVEQVRDFRLSQLGALEDLGPVAAWDEIGDLQIHATAIQYMSELSWTNGGSLTFSNNLRLTEVDLSGLEGLDGDLTISGNRGLVSFSAPDLRYAQSLSIPAHPIQTLDFGALEGLDALTLQRLEPTSFDMSSLRNVRGAIRYYQTGGMTDMGLPALESVGSIEILYSSGLTSLGLDALVQIQGNLTILYGIDLERVDAPVLDHVDGTMSLYQLGGVVDLDELSALTQIGGTLNLRNIASLDDVTGLHGVTNIGGDLSIIDNAGLATQDAEALRDAIGTSNVGGVITISGNGG